MGKEGETLSRMYDDQRECLISALPTRCYKVRNMGERGWASNLMSDFYVSTQHGIKKNMESLNA